MVNREMSSENTGALNILVVDDEANIRRTLALCLEAKGHQVTAVGNVVDAKAEAERQAFELALVDMRLGADNGLDLIPVLLASATSAVISKMLYGQQLFLLVSTSWDIKALPFFLI